MRHELDLTAGLLHKFTDKACPDKPHPRKKRDTKAQKKAKRKSQKIARRINRR